MFIDNKRFIELRKKASEGDDKAVAILRAYRDGNDNVTAMVEEYFKKPDVTNDEGIDKPDENLSRLEKYLRDNNVKEGDEDYDEYVEEFYKMFPEEKEEGNGEEANIEVEHEAEAEHESEVGPEEERELDVEPEVKEDIEPDEEEEINEGFKENCGATNNLFETIKGVDAMVLDIIRNNAIKGDKKSVLINKLQNIKNSLIEYVKAFQEIEDEISVKEEIL